MDETIYTSKQCFTTLFQKTLFKSFSFYNNVVILCCSGEKSRTRKRYLLFTLNIKSPILNSNKKKSKTLPFVVHYYEMPMLYPDVAILAWAIFVTSLFGWACGDAFVQMNGNKILTLSFLINLILCLIGGFIGFLYYADN